MDRKTKHRLRDLFARSSVSRPIIVIVMMATSLIPAIAVAASEDEIRCGPMALPGQYGPYDYRTATAEQKFLVEGGHFTANVERLKSGTGTNVTRPGPDIDYTLRAFPNHPRALKAMMELGFRDKTNRPFGARWTVDCYFNRGIRMAPDDPQVRMLYATFLLRSGDKRAAAQQLEVASAARDIGGNLSYNIGLVYFQLQDYEKARKYAQRARELGVDLMGLQNMLMRAGQWRDDGGESKPNK